MINNAIKWLKTKRSNADSFWNDFNVIQKQFPKLTQTELEQLRVIHKSGLSFERYSDDKTPDVVGQGEPGPAMPQRCLP